MSPRWNFSRDRLSEQQAAELDHLLWNDCTRTVAPDDEIRAAFLAFVERTAVINHWTVDQAFAACEDEPDNCICVWCRELVFAQGRDRGVLLGRDVGDRVAHVEAKYDQCYEQVDSFRCDFTRSDRGRWRSPAEVMRLVLSNRPPLIVWLYSRRSETAHFPRRRLTVVRLPSAANVVLGRLI
jgi:hypothetical protein